MRFHFINSSLYLRPYFVALLGVALVLGCDVKLISDYDQVIDNAITTLHIDTETFLAHLAATAGTPSGSYDVNKEFYVNTIARLEALKMRAEASPKNENTAEMIGVLFKMFKEFDQLHSVSGSSGLSIAQLESERNSLGKGFQSVMALEIAKRQGKENQAGSGWLQTIIGGAAAAIIAWFVTRYVWSKKVKRGRES